MYASGADRRNFNTEERLEPKIGLYFGENKQKMGRRLLLMDRKACEEFLDLQTAHSIRFLLARTRAR